MPIIDHADVRLAPVMERVRERYLVSKDQGAVSLTVKEVEISPGWEGRMHTHPVDVAIQVLSGAIQGLMPRYNNMRKNFSAIVGYPIVVK